MVKVKPVQNDNGMKNTICLQSIKNRKMQKKRMVQPIQKTHKAIGQCAN